MYFHVSFKLAVTATKKLHDDFCRKIIRPGSHLSKSHSKSHSKEPWGFLQSLKGGGAQALISDDPGQSLRKFDCWCKRATMRRIAEEDLRYKSYTLKIRQMLSEAARTSRGQARTIARCNVFFEKASGWIRFFSDEKIFIVDVKINRRTTARLQHWGCLYCCQNEISAMFTC